MLWVRHMEDPARELVHRQNHQLIWRCRRQRHPPGHWRSTGCNGAEGRLRRPLRLFGRERTDNTQGRVTRVVRRFCKLPLASDGSIRDADESPTPYDGHSPIFRGIASTTARPTWEVLTCFENVHGSKPVRDGRVGLVWQGQTWILGN